VAATDPGRLPGILAIAVVTGLHAEVLPDDRADVLYHSYNGGDVEVTGPSILVRKGDSRNYSVSGNYYVDSISSASVDVVTQGSPYAEERTQKSLSVDYLHANTLLSLGYTNSDESDYRADTASFSIIQTLFGDLTTVTLGYNLGMDTVGRHGDPAFDAEVDRRQYRLGLSQILTKNLLMTMNLETVTDEGYLNNPYRSVRYLDAGSPLGYSYQPEAYPRTRTSNALAAGLRVFLPYRAALGGTYRYFLDDWDIQAHTLDIEYTHPFGDHWTFDLGYRYHTQTAADFYSDLFPYADAQNFMARDKELSAFNDHSIGIGASYEFLQQGWNYLKKASVNVKYRRFLFSYDDYRDLTVAANPGEEPLYDFNADVWQLYFSVWY
jgi:hypothetical protein